MLNLEKVCSPTPDQMGVLTVFFKCQNSHWNSYNLPEWYRTQMQASPLLALSNRVSVFEWLCMECLAWLTVHWSPSLSASRPPPLEGSGSRVGRTSRRSDGWPEACSGWPSHWSAAGGARHSPTWLPRKNNDVTQWQPCELGGKLKQQEERETKFCSHLTPFWLV